MIVAIAITNMYSQTNTIQLRNGSNTTTILPSASSTIAVQIPALSAGTHFLLTSTTNPGSSGAAGSFLTYGTSAAQNSSDISATNYLFNVGYAATAVEQAALGGLITSTATGTNRNATALTLAATGTGTGTSTALYITNGRLTFTDSDDSHITSFTTGNQAANINYTLPTADGTSGQVLTTNGSGVLSWAASSSVSAINDLSDAVKDITDFSGSMILGHQTTGTLNSASDNTAVGMGAMQSITSGDENTALGTNALLNLTAGHWNTAIGNRALRWGTGSKNTYVGASAGRGTSLASSDDNVAVGYDAHVARSTGSRNVIIGSTAGSSLNTGSENVIIGQNAGLNLVTGSLNVWIGYNAGPSTMLTGATQTLYIDNSRTDSPLIYGDFSGNTLTFNGATTTTGDVTLGSGTSTTGGSIIMNDNSTSDSFTATISLANLSASRAYTIPEVSADASFVMTEGAQTVNGAKTFGSAAVFNTSAKLKSNNGSGGVILQAGAMSNTDVTYTLPAADGTSGYYFSTNGSGTLSWAPNSLDNLSDAKSGGTDFSSSMILGHQTTGTLSAAADNTGVGYGTLASITSGQNNTAIGSHAGNSVTSGERNTYLGSFASRDGSGSNNTYIGSLSGGPFDGATSGSENTGVGATALNRITTGQTNVAIGKDAGFDLTSGSGNVLIGYSAGYSLTTQSNRLYISNSNDATPLIYGEFDTDILRFNGRVGIGGAPGATYELDVVGDINYSGALSNVSDARLKRNILPISNALDIVLRLRPVSYEKRANLLSNDYTMKQLGFIAQEVEKVLPNSVNTAPTADAIKSVDYMSIIPVLTKALQEQQGLIAKQQELVAKQQQEIDELKKMVKRMSLR
jgi:hypothetical protein